MRTLVVMSLAAALFATNLSAAEVSGPLAPGEVAGVKKAQAEDDRPLYWLVGGAAVIGVVALAVGGNGNSTAQTALSGTGTL